MCGIVGLHLKSPEREDELGRLLLPMMTCMGSRGADSAGLAIYSSPVPSGQYRYSVRLGELHAATDSGGSTEDTAAAVKSLIDELATALGTTVECERMRADGAVMVTTDDVALVARELQRLRADAVVMGFGRSLEVIKDVGSPDAVCQRFDIADRTGFHAVGHTRMATESAVTIDHSHPFAPTHDLSVVHNGSFSNPSSVRRALADEGIECVTDNDTEVASRLIGRGLNHVGAMHAALTEVATPIDGFSTLLVATVREFAVVRDSFACKPLVVAETADYVAVTSEYIAMTSLPGIASAQFFEPKPEEIYTWTR